MVPEAMVASTHTVLLDASDLFGGCHETKVSAEVHTCEWPVGEMPHKSPELVNGALKGLRLNYTTVCKEV